MRSSKRLCTLFLALLLVIAVLLCGRSFLYYRAMDQWATERQDMVNNDLEFVLTSLQACLEEDQGQIPQHLEAAALDLRNFQFQMMEMEGFAAYTVQCRRQFLFGDRLKYHQWLGKADYDTQNSSVITQGCHKFAAFLERCAQEEVYLDQPDQFREALTHAIAELEALSEVLKEHDTTEAKNSKEFAACIFCFLKDATPVVANGFLEG